MIEVALPGQAATYYANLAPSQAGALMQRYFQPRGLLRRAGSSGPALLDGLLLDEAPPQDQVTRFSMSKRDPAVRAFLENQVHIATEHFGELDPLNLDEYLAHDGFAALRKCLQYSVEPPPRQDALCNQQSKKAVVNERISESESGNSELAGSLTPASLTAPANPQSAIRNPQSADLSPEQLISAIEKSGLRGRGGAGFPTGKKWRAVRRQPGDVKYVICNGDEGDPGAFMDRMILESFPFRVIEGLALAAVAVGAHEGIFYVRHEYPLAVRRVRAAIAELEKRGWLGASLLGAGFPLRLSVVEGAGAFVCGEETALIASRGRPARHAAAAAAFPRRVRPLGQTDAHQQRRNRWPWCRGLSGMARRNSPPSARPKAKAPRSSPWPEKSAAAA